MPIRYFSQPKLEIDIYNIDVYNLSWILVQLQNLKVDHSLIISGINLKDSRTRVEEHTVKKKKLANIATVNIANGSYVSKTWKRGALLNM